ncbi:hypothetical protein GCM10022419_105970 [Nonomuraea rosea]|uniref:AAA+ ATPase domain-containing protein n=1 Tax=Nonomuraea rosea TaxID=638574 RepID=A0ABP6ZDC6_9ACTN
MTTGNPPSPDDGNDHFLRPDGATVVDTEALYRTYVNLDFVLEHRGMACLYGDTGLGKTTTVNTAVRRLVPEGTIHMSCCTYAGSIRGQLIHALRLQGHRPRHPQECDNLLKTTLAEKFRILVCDEAHLLPVDGFEYLRHLWDDPRTAMTIVFVGEADCPEALELMRSPLAASRIELYQKITSMTMAEVLEVIPTYHPIWADADVTLIDLADRQAAHGNWRAWAHLTALVARALERLQRSAVDEDVLRGVLDRLRPP